MADELAKYDAMGLSDLIRKGEITPAELLEITIHRIEKINPKLNAVIYKMYDQARAAAEIWSTGTRAAKTSEYPFCGIPFLLKDLIAECKDTPFSDGSRAVHGYNSKLDSEIVKRYKASGLIIVGKSNSSEFGVLTTTEPSIHGPTFNPWDLNLTPGGSSGGSAATVAAGIMPMAHGCDGGGSIRIPASCCGVFGLKPTRGRNPLGPLFGDLGGGIIHEHAVTLTVRDSAALLDVSSGPDLGDPYYAPPKKRPFFEEIKKDVGRLKIGFLTSVPEGWNEETALHPDCDAAVRDAANLCEELGHYVEEVSAAQLSHSNLPQTFVLIFSCFVEHVIAYWERELGKKIKQDELEPPTWDLYQESLKTTGGAYLAAKEELQRFSRKMANWYQKENYDLLLSPTMRIPPTQIGSFQPSPDDPMKWIRIALSFVAFTRTQNITGEPAMSVPLYWNKDNIPIGVQFSGRFGDEATLFRLAAQLEQARPWAGKNPPIHCTNLLRSRNLDYIDMELFEPWLLIFYKPSSGHSFVSVSTPAAIGVLTAMNENGITFGNHEIYRSSTKWQGIPSDILHRLVIQHSSSLNEAETILAHANRTIPQLWMMTDTNTAVNFEFNQKKLAIERMTKKYLVLTNHTRQIKEGFSYTNTESRYSHAVSFLEQNHNDMNLEKLIFLNRTKTICCDYGSSHNIHAAIFKPATLDFWVAIDTPVATRGKWVGFNLSYELYKKGRDPEPAIIPPMK